MPDTECNCDGAEAFAKSQPVAVKATPHHTQRKVITIENDRDSPPNLSQFRGRRSSIHALLFSRSKITKATNNSSPKDHFVCTVGIIERKAPQNNISARPTSSRKVSRKRH